MKCLTSQTIRTPILSKHLPSPTAPPLPCDMNLLSYKKYNRRIIKILLWKNKLSLVRYLHMYFTSSPSSPLHHACSRSPSSFLCIPPSYLISKSFTKQHEFHARDDFLAVQIEALKKSMVQLGVVERALCLVEEIELLEVPLYRC